MAWQLNAQRLLTDLSLTRAVGQIILLALDSILQALCFAARLLNALLHGLRSDIVRHGEGSRLDAGVNWGLM